MPDSDLPNDEFRKHGYSISTDKGKLNIEFIHRYLRSAYWSTGISVKQIENSINNSFCFGVYDSDNQQVGFARVVTDFVSAGYLVDVFILDEHSRQGLGKWLVETIVTHANLKAIRRFLLFTRDAHGLYAKYGFEPLNEAENCMQIYRGVDFNADSNTPINPASQDGSGFVPRCTEMIGVEELNGWLLKLYCISASGENLPAQTRFAATEFLLERFDWPTHLQTGYGFITIHLGLDATWLLMDLWADDILHHFIYASQLGGPTNFAPAPADGTMACVWELEVTRHERDAWVRHVLSRPGDRDYAKYLDDSLTIEFPNGLDSVV